jgi:hypothetical protein
MLVLEVCLSWLVLVASMAIIKKVWLTSPIAEKAPKKAPDFTLEWPDIYITRDGNHYHLNKCRYVNEKTKRFNICLHCKP